MYPGIIESYLPFLRILSKDVPDFLLAFLEAPVMKRLADISVGCGLEYSKFYSYKVNQSRLTHSMGVALIVWNFTHDEKQTLAWLFHDISHSVFSHVGDFLIGDAENQESSEQHMNKLLSNDPVIIRELKKLGISIAEVDDYTLYPIADNHGPQLSADRLEYTLIWWLILWTKTLEDIEKMYTNITILTDEHWDPELWFTDIHLAKEFAMLALENSRLFSSHPNAVCMHFLADILRKMLDRKLITPDEMYTRTESETISCIKHCWDMELIEMWKFYEQLDNCVVYTNKPNSDLFVVSSKVKRRYIDPLVQIWSERTRISTLFPDFKEILDSYIQKQEEWISIDWKI